jgi:anti-sigma B factor antagonist
VRTSHGDWVVLSVIGDLDLATAPGLRQDVLALISEGRRHVVVDLGPTDFVDSVGIGMLVAVLKRLRVHGGELAIACPDARLQRLFSVVDLDRIVTIAASVEAAIGPDALRAGSVPRDE